MSSLIGAISVFNHDVQEWSVFKSKLQQWFIANDITSETDKLGVKRRAVLLSALSDTTFQLASNLVLPSTPDKLGYEVIVNALDVHFTPKRSGFTERYNFYSATQHAGESHSQWAARLRGLAAHCQFKNLEEALLDKFIMGLQYGPEKEKLFGMQISTLSLAQAVDAAESVRCARAGLASAAPATIGEAAVFKIEKDHQLNKVKCAVCGRKSHKTSECRFAKYKCTKCNTKGHLRRMCKGVNFINSTEEGECDDGELFSIRCYKGAPMVETVLINKVELQFQIDSGSSVSAISEKTYNNFFSDVPLSQSNKFLFSYNGGSIKSLGKAQMPVSYLGKTKCIAIFVICDGGPPILGRDFIELFNLELSPINYCDASIKCQDLELQNLLSQFKEVFSDRLGCFNQYKIRLRLKQEAKPIFFKARPVPFALKEKIDKEIDRLLKSNVIESVNQSEYASPIVPVLKNDGAVRLCADYSQTLNKQLHIDKYPLPTVNELFTKLHGGVQFTKLDMSSAYTQFEIIDDNNITCINTHRGLFKYNRLIFGLSSAPAVFQKAIDSILNMEGVLCFLDDVLITGKNRGEHMYRLKKVLQRLKEANLTLKKNKCEFFRDQITYLGYDINKSGIKKSIDKVKAISQAPRPSNISELQSFIGLVNYYRCFVPNASAIMTPLYDLLKKGASWSWSAEQESAFNNIKEKLTSEDTLAHFDPSAKLILTVDASPKGLGAILSQIGPSDNIERPISYASRTLSAAEKNYSQIQKEATAIIFGVKKYHQYLYGRADPFILCTDHKPLVAIFGSKKGVPEVSANRLQRYALYLASYNYEIRYVRSANNTADFLSRAVVEPIDKAIIENTSSARETAAYINFVVEGSLPVTHKELVKETHNDRILQIVIRYVQNGWPPKIDDKELKPFFLCRLQLSLECGCLLRGHKVVIPSSLQNKILDELHGSHLGIVKTKALARSKFWFPGVDAAIENLINSCSTCISMRVSPPKVPIVPWPYPKHPFSRLHLDFLGPIHNNMYLVIVDAYTKWLECYNMRNNITTKMLVIKLTEFMSRFGIPQAIVSDNGTSFVSKEFTDFCELNDIKHLTSPVYHPASNGQAESSVKIVKKGLKCALLLGRNETDINNRLLKYLFDYRNSQHSTTGESPASLVFGRPLRSRLDLLTEGAASTATTVAAAAVASKDDDDVGHTSSHSSLAKHVRANQSLQSNYHRGTIRDFNIGEAILFKVYTNKNVFSWEKGTISQQLGKVLYIIKDISGNIYKRHKNQIISYKGTSCAFTPATAEIVGEGRERLHRASSAYEEAARPETQPASATEIDPNPATEPTAHGQAEERATRLVVSPGSKQVRMVLRNVPRINYKL